MLKIAKGNNRNVSLKQREEIRNILSRVEKDSHQETNLNFLNMFKGQKISGDTLGIINCSLFLTYLASKMG